jgi:hypothetical protein
MTFAEFNALQVVDTIAEALLLSLTTKGGAQKKFLFSDNPAGGKNSQQNRSSATVMNRVTYFTRIAQEKCCGTHGTMTTKHSASLGLDRVYPGPYPGIGRAGYAASHDILT